MIRPLLFALLATLAACSEQDLTVIPWVVGEPIEGAPPVEVGEAPPEAYATDATDIYEQDEQTTNVDIYATLAELFGVTPRHTTHGVSLGPLCRGEVDSLREWTLGGVWGQWVQLNDGARLGGQHVNSVRNHS